MRLYAAFLLLLLPGLLPAEDKEKVKDKDRLKGTWLVVGLELEGRTEDSIGEQKIKFVFAGGKLSVLTPKKENDLEFTWQIDDSTAPRILDITGVKGNLKDQVFEGIYKFDGDKLIYCVRGPQGLRERPTNFTTREGSNLFVVRLEKVK